LSDLYAQYRKLDGVAVVRNAARLVDHKAAQHLVSSSRRLLYPEDLGNMVERFDTGDQITPSASRVSAVVDA
jgi:hypothetical protein